MHPEPAPPSNSVRVPKTAFTCAGTLFGCARQLGERDNGHAELLRQRLQTTTDLADLLLTILGARDVHELLLKALRRQNSEGNVRAAAICSDIGLTKPDSTDSTSEIAVRLESKAGESRVVHIPYAKGKLIGINFKAETITPEESIIFHEKPPAPAPKPVAKKKPHPVSRRKQ